MRDVLARLLAPPISDVTHLVHKRAPIPEPVVTSALAADINLENVRPRPAAALGADGSRALYTAQDSDLSFEVVNPSTNPFVGGTATDW
jgi:hypothetical protein